MVGGPPAPLARFFESSPYFPQLTRRTANRITAGTMNFFINANLRVECPEFQFGCHAAAPKSAARLGPFCARGAEFRRVPLHRASIFLVVFVSVVVDRRAE